MNVDYSWWVRWKEMVKGGVYLCVHTPDQDYVPKDSYRTCLPLRLDLCLSGQRCTHRDSYPSHSVCLGNERHHMI